jgi:signal transduction histidine kinase
VVVFTPIMWVVNGGTHGSFQYFIPFFIVGFHVSASLNTRRILIPLLILITISLIIAEYFYPEFVISYPSDFDRYADLMSGFFISLTGIYIYANVYFNQVQEANKKLIAQNMQLSKSREEVLVQQKKIKNQNVELGEKNETLEELNRTKDLFLSIISHDLRSPFNSLLGLTEILILNKEKIQNSEMIRLVDSIHESAEQAYKLVLNLLEWSKLQSDRIEYSPIRLNLKKVALSNIELIKIQANNKGIEIYYENGGDGCYVNADENMVNTIIRNLISNAIKYTQSGGKIIIKCNCSELWCSVSVCDTGIGIPEETLKQIVNTDDKVSTKGTLGELGTGLGLVLCKEFAKRNNGKIEAESEVKKGSTFTLKLPVVSEVE